MIQKTGWFFLSFVFQICVAMLGVCVHWKKVFQLECASGHACLGIVDVMFGRCEVLVYTSGAPNELFRHIAVSNVDSALRFTDYKYLNIGNQHLC